MLTLRTAAGLALDVEPGTSVSLEAAAYLLSEADNNGTYSLPFTLPRSPANQRALGYVEALDTTAGLGRSLEGVELYDDGHHLLTGTLRLLSFTATGYAVSLSYGASAVMARLKATKLRDLTLGGLRVPTPASINPARPYPVLTAHMDEVMANPAAFDYVFAPYCNNDALGEYPAGWPRFPNVNAWLQAVDGQTGAVFGTFSLTSGYVANFPVQGLNPPSPFPDFYPFYKLLCAPCVKLRYLVYALCRELDIPLEEDFFDAETSQLVVLGMALAEDPLITGYARAQLHGLGPGAVWFRLADVLPDLTGAELLRKLADTFFLDISVSPLGALRLRRSQALLSRGPQLVLSRAAGPAPDVDVSAELPHLVTAYRTEADDYTKTQYQVVDPNQLGAPVLDLADLPTVPDFPHQVRHVYARAAYYQHNEKGWAFYSVVLDTPTLGPAAAETTVSVTQGVELVLEQVSADAYLLPAPGEKWEGAIVNEQPPGEAMVRVPVLGQRMYAPTYNLLARSEALRLAFYRGFRPYANAATATSPGAATGSYPLLSITEQDTHGQALGSYSLLLHGPAGTARQFGVALLPLKACPYTVSWPVWLSEEQFYQLDLARTVEIDGLEFAIRKVSLTFPLRKPAQFDLVLRVPGLELPEWRR